MDDRPVFDAAKFKTTTRAQWQAAAEAWHRWGPFLGQWLGAATEQMLDLAHIKEGGRVLDIAAGAGEQSVSAAQRVGPTGHVLATDIAPALLDYALVEARAAGLSNVETRELDGERLETLPAAGFDAAISRVGLIYFPDQQARIGGNPPCAEAGRALRGDRLFDTRQESVLLDPGRHHPAPRQAAATLARPAGPVFAWRRRRAGSGLRARWPARHRSAQGRLSGAATKRSRMRAFRTRIVRRICIR